MSDRLKEATIAMAQTLYDLRSELPPEVAEDMTVRWHELVDAINGVQEL